MIFWKMLKFIIESGIQMVEQLLNYFSRHKDKFISGEQLSRHFNCSRTAIWKQIEALRKQGYTFQAKPRLGYRLLTAPVTYDLARLTSCIQTKVMGSSLRLYDTVDSTQNMAHDLAREGAHEGTLVVAEQQTNGRGRLGRIWHSPSGKGIWMSLILKPRIPVQFSPQLTLLTAVALCRSLQRSISQQIGIKWPNDLLIGGRKVSGILLESSTENERLHNVIVGIGISVNLTEQDYPEDLLPKATSLLIESGHLVQREEVICHFLQQFEELYALYHLQGFAPIRLLWEALSVSLHCPIRIQSSTGFVEGIAHSIDEMGALEVLQHDGSLIKVYSGDIFL